MQILNSDWWNKNYKNPEFESWLKDDGSYSRSIVVGILRNYSSVLDCGCGTCYDYYRYKHDDLDISYTGIDSCSGLVEQARLRGICAQDGDIRNIPFGDNSFDVVTGRHILEHVDGFERAIKEMHRVARKEVVITFFLPPQENELIGTDPALNNEVNLNIYSRAKIEQFVLTFADMEWIRIGSEEILRIFKKPGKIGAVCTLYIDNDFTYAQALHTLDAMRCSSWIKLYARITKLDDKYKDILKRFDDIEYNDENILARSWNKGIEKAFKDDCEYVLFPNLDIHIEENTIDNMIEFSKKDDSVMWSGRCSNTGAHYPDGDFVVNSYTVYDNFAFPMVGKKLFETVGKFDENFIPCYGEDVDMQYRIELAGQKHTCVASAPFIHYGQTTANNSEGWVGKTPQDKAHEYFMEKWGGFPREHKFKTPFNK